MQIHIYATVQHDQFLDRRHITVITQPEKPLAGNRVAHIVAEHVTAPDSQFPQQR